MQALCSDQLTTQTPDKCAVRTQNIKLLLLKLLLQLLLTENTAR